MANSVDPDEMLLSVASHLGLHCLLRSVSLNTYSKYGNSVLNEAMAIFFTYFYKP